MSNHITIHIYAYGCTEMNCRYVIIIESIYGNCHSGKSLHWYTLSSKFYDTGNRSFHTHKYKLNWLLFSIFVLFLFKFHSFSSAREFRTANENVAPNLFKITGHEDTSDFQIDSRTTQKCALHNAHTFEKKLFVLTQIRSLIVRCLAAAEPGRLTVIDSPTPPSSNGYLPVGHH